MKLNPIPPGIWWYCPSVSLNPKSIHTYTVWLLVSWLTASWSLFVSKTPQNLSWPYLFIAWVLTPCHRSKNVLKYVLESISSNKSFPVGWVGAQVILMSTPGPIPLTLDWTWPGAGQHDYIYVQFLHVHTNNNVKLGCICTSSSYNNVS